MGGILDGMESDLIHFILCGAIIIQSMFLKIIITGTPKLAHEGEVWAVFSEFEV